MLRVGPFVTNTDPWICAQLKKTVFRIRIHLIPIQHFRLNTDPDPDPIRIQIQSGSRTNPDPDPIRIRFQGFDDQKFMKFAGKKKLNLFFDQKLQVTYSWASIKDVEATEEAFSPQKRTSSNSKHKKNINFFLLLWVIDALLDPDPDSESGYRSSDLIKYGSNPDPDTGSEKLQKIIKSGLNATKISRSNQYKNLRIKIQATGINCTYC
jgi:hypothetical protein